MMGAHTVIKSHKACGEQELKSWFAEQLDEMMHEGGDDEYCGNWNSNSGLAISSKVFKTTQEARQYIADNTRKWESVLAVRVGDFSKTFPETKAQKVLVEKLEALQKEYTEFERNVLIRAQSAKSKTKKCTHCESSINVKKMYVPSIKDMTQAGRDPGLSMVRHANRLFVVSYHEMTNCPVCNMNLLMTDTDKKNKTSVEKRLHEAQMKVRAEKEAYQRKNMDKPQACWVVGGVCAS